MHDDTPDRDMHAMQASKRPAYLASKCCIGVEYHQQDINKACVQSSTALDLVCVSCAWVPTRHMIELIISASSCVHGCGKILDKIPYLTLES